jgi:hypothetical protein
VADRDLQAMPYADLWLDEMGRTVPQWDGLDARPHRSWETDPGPAASGPVQPAPRA